eukprot:6177214-Pleurochrysis_carterae.AAC.3
MLTKEPDALKHASLGATSQHVLTTQFKRGLLCRHRDRHARILLMVSVLTHARASISKTCVAHPASLPARRAPKCP